MKLRKLFITIAFAPMAVSSEDLHVEINAKNSRAELSLQQITQRVQESSELIQAQKLRSESTEAQGRQASAWQNPYLAAEIGRLRDTYNNRATYDFRLTQPIYFPGKQSKHREVFERQKDMQEMQTHDLAQSLALEATYFAYAYHVAESKTTHIQKRIERMSLMRSYMRAQAYVSPAKIIHRNIVTNQLVSLQKLLNTELAAAESSWQKLNIYLNQEERINVNTPWLIELKAFDKGQFLERVRSGNRRIKIKNREVAWFEASLGFQKKIPLPDVSLTAFVRDEALEIPGPNRFFGGAVTVPLPVLNVNSAGIEAAEKQLEAARVEKSYVQREVLQLARAAYAEYSQKRLLLGSFSAGNIALVEKQMRYADRELKLGRIDLLSYLELELKTHEVLNSFYDTQLELVRAITQMIYLMGESATYTGDLYVFQNH